MKKVYSYDENGVFIGSAAAQIDPLETKLKGEKVFLVPANAVEVAPPKVPEGKVAKWRGGKWEIEEAPAKEEPKETEEPAKDPEPEIKPDPKREEITARADRAAANLRALKTENLTLEEIRAAIRDIVSILAPAE